jgi:hypothetical protein
MLSKGDEERIKNSLKEIEGKWIWIDILTNIGPTKLERYFQGMIEGDFLHHWSPTYPEGYLEIRGSRNVVIHWVLGEENKIIGIFPLDDVDFDEIDEALSSTIIQNSVIRIFSDKF